MPSLTTRHIILDVLNDGMPHTTREVVARGIGENAFSLAPDIAMTMLLPGILLVTVWYISVGYKLYKLG